MSAWTDNDIKMMRAAIELALEAEEVGEVPVGAVVVANNEIIGRGRNRTLEDNDPSGHAEVVALRTAAREVGNHRISNATLFVTLEPCAMCMGAIAQARISRVVFGAYDEKGGAAGSVIDLSESRALNHRPEINGGLLRDDCGAPLRRFFSVRR